MSPSPAGGPATINGIVYQLLWSLLRSSQIHVERTDLSPDATSGTSVTLILEPVGGGGDIQEHTPDGRRIQQLKAGTHSWSLQDIVADVLPDLYLEVDIDRSEDSYEFVTEGWRGNWKEACDFFGSLNIRQCPDSDVLDALDNTRSIRFGHQTSGKDPFWPDSTYTERTLFERIASNLLKSSPTVQQLGHDTNILHRNLWHLLGHFKFIENQKSSHLQSKIDRVLLEIVPINTNLPATRDALLFDLARRASVGGAQIVPSTFFAENGLQAVPLSHWTAIQDNATHILKRQLNRLGYIPEEDVRVAEPPMSWPLQTPLLALTGESGQGKSWWLFNLALQLSDTNPVVLISSINNAERDMQAAAQIFANIADQDNNLRLERVAARLKTIGSPHHQLWLYLLIDDVQEVSVARRLALQDWEEWGIVPVIAGNPDAIRAFSETANSRGVVCEAGDFSIPQLQRYLTDGDILTFYTIPGDVRDTLRRPLLARLYRDLVRETLYRPENEYELYALSWEEVFRNANAEERLAEASLHRLAQEVLAGGAYPWSSPQIASSGMTEGQLAFLLHRGVLQEATGGTFRIWHDRLLNWIVAQALVTAWRNGNKNAAEVVQDVTRIWRDPYGTWGRMLGYVPMDVFWLLTRTDGDSQALLDDLLIAMEGCPPLSSDTMYRELLPPIGDAIVPALVRRMEAQTVDDQWTYIKPLAEALAAFSVSVTTPICLQLLQSGVYALQSAACEVLYKRPDKQALEPLWTLLQDINLHEDKYQKEGSSWALASSLAQECSKALESCAMLDPDWVEHVILFRSADSASLICLAYMLPDLPDGQARSQRCQAKLQAHLNLEHARAVAHIMYRFPDPSAASWLKQRVSQRAGLLGAASLQALTRLDASIAVDALQDLPEDDLYGTRRWTLLPLLMKEPEAVRERFLVMLRTSEDPLRLLNAFQDFEDELSEAHLNVALDALEQRLAAATDLSKLNYGDLWGPLNRICSANSPEALICLAHRRGSLLEQKLTEWLLLRSPRKTNWADHLNRLGIEMLYRIGGEGFTQAVNAWLRSGIHFGIIDALNVAFKRPDAATIKLLSEMVTQSSPDKDLRFQRYLAVKALAFAEAWEPLVKAILACGFDIPHDVMYACLGTSPLSDEILAPAIQALSSQEVPVGALLAIGMAQREDLESKIVEVLERSTPGSDMEKAALLSLSVLTTKEERTARLISERRKQANVDPEYIRIALLNNQSDAGNALLQINLTQTWDINTAISLLDRNYAVEQILEGLREHIRRTLADSPLSLFRNLSPIIHGLKEEHKHSLFTPDMVDRLYEIAFTPEGFIRIIGAKETIMRCLAVINPQTAYAVVLRELQDPMTQEREGYPTLLVEIDSGKAVKDLFEIMRVERSSTVRAAIGRALRSQDIQARLKEWAQHTDADRRQGACRIAEYQEPTTDVLALVRACLNDSEVKVYEAAVTAILALRRLRRQTTLLSTMQDQPEASQRWLLLDTAIQVGDLGDNHNSWREAWISVYRDSPHMVRDYIAEAMKTRREEIEKEHQDQDERG